MYSRQQIAAKYIRYFLTAANGKGHGVHSPFVFHFIREVLRDKSSYPAYTRVEQLRGKLLNNNTVVEVEDLGAGSAMNASRQRTVSSIARNSAKSPKFSQLLFRIANKYQCGSILELGTSLGITTCYLSLANPGGNVMTIEGAPAIAGLAQKNFDELELKNIKLVKGYFDEVLPLELQNIEKPDLAFIDGNHAEEPTLRYFNLVMEHAHPGSILVFDDIHWSKGMEQAWRGIQEDSRVTCTIDLFFIGLVFLREEFREKQHFVIRY